MQEQITLAIIGALSTIVVAIVQYVARAIVAYLDNKGVVETLKSKDYLVRIAIDAANQIYEKEQGAEKFAFAKAQALKLLAANGIAIDESELEDFIEAAVGAAKTGTQEALTIKLDTLAPTTLKIEE